MSFSAIVMAGGRATRMGGVEKPMLSFRGKPLIDYSLEALGVGEVEEVVVAVTPNTPRARTYLGKKRVETIITPGEGYVEDLSYALRELGPGKTLTLTSDLPLVRKEEVRYVLQEYSLRGCPSLAVVAERELCRRLGLRVDMELPQGIPTGINVVDSSNLEGEECYLVVNNLRLAVNVNYLQDLDKAEEILKEVENAH